jgi:UDP-glucose 4-epimerase
MRYVVTGAAGFIGSHIARRLREDGHDVVILDNLTTGFRSNVPDGCELFELDIADGRALDSVPEMHCDAVLHLAAQSSGEISHDDPLLDLRTNTFGTLQLLHWARRRGIERFLYASSMTVYGLIDELPIREDARFTPHSFYGIHKLASEHYVEHFAKAGMRTTVLRMFNVFGPGQNLANMKQGMVSIYLASMLRSGRVLVKGSKDRFRDFIDIDDVVSAWIAALQSPAAWGRTYNVGRGMPVTVEKLLSELEAAGGYAPGTLPIEYAAGTPGDQFGVYADVDAIKRDLGWTPRVNLHDGLRKMAAWARSEIQRAGAVT